MRTEERKRGLLRAPKLLWDLMLRGRYDFIYDCVPMTSHTMTRAKRVNLVRAGLNLVYRRLVPWSMPLHMQFELTNYCGLKCPVCPSGTGAVERPPQAMSPEIFERVMDEVGPYLLTASLWAWGEPTFHPQLKEILRIARRHPVITLLSTNGQRLCDNQVREALLEEPPSHLIVAIDGLTEETNSRYRVRASLEPVLQGVRALADAKRSRGQSRPVLHMRYIVMRHNQHELPQLEAFARDSGFDLLSVRTLSIIDSDSPDAAYCDLMPDSGLYRAYEYIGGERVRRGGFICQQPFWFPTLLADGTLVACEQDFNARHPIGAIPASTSFRELWFGRRAAEVRRFIRDHPQDFSFCVNCPFSYRPRTDASVQAFLLNPDAKVTCTPGGAA